MWNNSLAAFKRESGGAAYITNSGDCLRFVGAELGGMVMGCARRVAIGLPEGATRLSREAAARGRVIFASIGVR